LNLSKSTIGYETFVESDVGDVAEDNQTSLLSNNSSFGVKVSSNRPDINVLSLYLCVVGDCEKVSNKHISLIANLFLKFFAPKIEPSSMLTTSDSPEMLLEYCVRSLEHHWYTSQKGLSQYRKVIDGKVKYQMETCLISPYTTDTDKFCQSMHKSGGAFVKFPFIAAPVKAFFTRQKDAYCWRNDKGVLHDETCDRQLLEPNTADRVTGRTTVYLLRVTKTVSWVFGKGTGYYRVFMIRVEFDASGCDKLQ
jgi:hypothetical protein